jgi:RNA polymerase sigma-70 factor (ECF subfamily)
LTKVEVTADPSVADFLPLDEERARQFVACFSPRIAAQAKRFRLSHDLCQDVVQETLVRALRALPSFRGDSKLSTWVYRIAWRECARVRAKRNRADRDGSAFPDGLEPVAADAVDGAELQDEVLRVRAAMAGLPEQQRLAMGYHYLDGMAVAEIASVMDATANTVKSWLKRGRDRIRERLE